MFVRPQCISAEQRRNESVAVNQNDPDLSREEEDQGYDEGIPIPGNYSKFVVDSFGNNFVWYIYIKMCVFIISDTYVYLNPERVRKLSKRMTRSPPPPNSVLRDNDMSQAEFDPWNISSSSAV